MSRFRCQHLTSSTPLPSARTPSHPTHPPHELVEHLSDPLLLLPQRLQHLCQLLHLLLLRQAQPDLIRCLLLSTGSLGIIVLEEAAETDEGLLQL